MLAAAGLVLLTAASLVQPMSVPGARARPGRARIPGLSWLFATALVIYGIAETRFGNWGTTLLVGRGIKPAAVSGKIRSTRSYVVLPWAICAALLLAPTARSAGAGIGLFAFGAWPARVSSR